MLVSIINNKGGVGKTTVSTNLGNSLGNKGKKILIVDQDPQCNSSAILLSAPAEDRTLYDLYSGKSEISVRDCIYATTYENVYVLPNLPKTTSLEVALYQNIANNYLITQKFIAEVQDDYDFIFFDCPPSLGLWSLQSLIASDFVIVPVAAGSRFAISGLIAAIETIESVGKTVNPNLKFLRLLINRVDLRTSVSKISVEMIRKRFGDSKVFNTSIPENTHIQAAELAGTTVLRHNPQSTGAKKFRDLADEFIVITNEITKLIAEAAGE